MKRCVNQAEGAADAAKALAEMQHPTEKAEAEEPEAAKTEAQEPDAVKKEVRHCEERQLRWPCYSHNLCWWQLEHVGLPSRCS